MTLASDGRLYAAYAATFLAVTVLSGTWLRAAFVSPGVLGQFTFGNALHAHSHLALYGWATMGGFAAVSYRLAALGRGGSGGRGGAGRGDAAAFPVIPRGWHPHAVGIASLAAFIGFLAGGYNVWTIAISMAHVALWFIFVALAWGPSRAIEGAGRPFFRAALVLLLLAGAGAMSPGIVMARGISDPWVGQIAIHSFLSPFIAGWLALTAMATVYARLRAPRFAAAALWCTVLGVLPSALLHPTAPPPASWLTDIGRIGTGLVGVGTLLFCLDLLRARSAAPLLRLATAAALIKGAGELGVGVGLGLDLIAVRSITIAYLHLLLLGMITPVLMHAVLRVPAAPRRVFLYAAGLGIMLVSLVGLGSPATAGLLLAVGLPSVGWLYWSALVGGATCALAIMILGASGFRRAERGGGGTSAVQQAARLAGGGWRGGRRALEPERHAVG